MIYHSTRDENLVISPSNAVIKGIADDGGLYMFADREAIKFDYRELMGKSTFHMASKIIGTLIDDFSKEEMDELVSLAYTGRFETDELTPVAEVGNKYVLELFRGPTSAFKDVALCMLPRLLTASCKKNNIKDEIVILTATSGDTGKAALSGFADVEGTSIIVFYPDNGVSAVQKAQMVTQKGKNVSVCAVRGNFDDAQTGVKNIFAKVSEDGLLDGKSIRLSSANSINIGRLAPQVVYYFKAYSDLICGGKINEGDEVNFCVPTGNFGDILAGYLAKLMGLPVGKLICASNANDVLTDFFATGEYNRVRPFKKTISPSMDILISSNLERMLYLASNCDCETVNKLMNELKVNGSYKVSADMKAVLDEAFAAGCCDDEQTKVTIKSVYDNHGYLCDTHTAVAFKVAEDYTAKTGDNRPMVVLSTASPFKFPASVADAIGLALCDDEFAIMQKLAEECSLNVPAGLKNLDTAEVLHIDVVDKDDMLQYVLDKVSENRE